MGLVSQRNWHFHNEMKQAQQNMKEQQKHIFSTITAHNDDDNDNDDAGEWNSIDIHGWYSLSILH